MIGHSDRGIARVDKFTPLNNNVLVKVEFDPEKDLSPAGLVKGNAWWDESGHVSRFGTVVSWPRVLLEREKGLGIEWGTEYEIQEGDTVFFGKMAGYNSEMVEINGDTHFLVDYAELILRIRDGEIYPLNGFVIVEKVSDLRVQSTLKIDFLSKTDKKRGIVRYLGRPNDYYFPKEYGIVEAADLRVDDEVIFQIAGYTELEDTRYAKLEGDLGYIQRRWIIGKIEYETETAGE